ncbi:MAG: hypothetical protein JWN70_5803 [Planctomycetaceae bacterium]|nr:hypothetical protein [Planctomycetaceae bacterium]
MILKTILTNLDKELPDLSEAAVEKYQQQVKTRYPRACWLCDRDFGRIVAGNMLLSLRFSMIDPQAEEMAWRDAAQRLGQ